MSFFNSCSIAVVNVISFCIICLLNWYFAEVVIGLEMVEYFVGEEQGFLEVCAFIMSGGLERDVEVRFTSGDPGTATSMCSFLSFN